MAGTRTDELMYFLKELLWSETQIASSEILSRIAYSISKYDYRNA